MNKCTAQNYSMRPNYMHLICNQYAKVTIIVILSPSAVIYIVRWTYLQKARLSAATTRIATWLIDAMRIAHNNKQFAT